MSQFLLYPCVYLRIVLYIILLYSLLGMVVQYNAVPVYISALSVLLPVLSMTCLDCGNVHICIWLTSYIVEG